MHGYKTMLQANHDTMNFSGLPAKLWNILVLTYQHVTVYKCGHSFKWMHIKKTAAVEHMKSYRSLTTYIQILQHDGKQNQPEHSHKLQYWKTDLLPSPKFMALNKCTLRVLLLCPLLLMRVLFSLPCVRPLVSIW